MKRFAILRDLDPRTTQQDIDAGAVETLLNMASSELVKGMMWEPGLYGTSWIRSYWEPGARWGMCLYGGESVDSIENYHAMCDVPYVEIREVEEVGPRAAQEADRGAEPPAGMQLAAIEHPVEAAASPSTAASALFARLCDEADSSRLAPPQWIRTYWDKERASALSFFAVDPGWEDFRSALSTAGCSVRQVLKVDPRDYLGRDEAAG